MDHLEKCIAWDTQNSIYTSEILESFEAPLLFAISQLEKTELPVNTVVTHINAAEMCSSADAGSLAYPCTHAVSDIHRVTGGRGVCHGCHVCCKMTVLFAAFCANLFSSTVTGRKKQGGKLKQEKLLVPLVTLQMPKVRINWLIRCRPSVRCLIIKRTSQDVFQEVV